MQTIDLQQNTDYSLVLDNFVGNICDINHIINYYATIEVPLMRAVECAFSIDETSSINVAFGFCPEGVCFKVTSNHTCFLSTELSNFPTPGSVDESMFLMSMLADGMEVSDDGKTVRLIFAVRGIDSDEAAERVKVLVDFAAVSPTLLQRV